MNKNNYIFLIVCFFLFLAWGVFSTGWYESAQLRIKGTAEQAKADLAFRWDSGEGLNDYESRHILVNVPYLEGSKQHIRIRALQEKHPASESTNVSIIRIILDGEEFDLKSVRPLSIFHDRLAIQLTPEQPVFEFDASVKENIRIVFANSYYFGKVAVEINGVSSTQNLYTSSGRYDERPYDYHLLQPDGAFQFDLDLPRYRIKRLYLQNKDPGNPVSFTDVSICHENTCKALEPDAQSSDSQLFFRKPNQSLKRYFDPVRFLFRVTFALLNTLFLWQLMILVRKSKGAMPFLRQGNSAYFWGFALIFAAVNSIVLAPFWPGVMSQDSLIIWRASGIPGVYLNDHPILNQIFYMYLRGFWNNPAVVPITQIAATSLLVAFVFDRIRKAGVALWLLLPLFLLLLCALPVHLYNIALWKDIPFALLAAAWGIFFVFTCDSKGDERRFISVTSWSVLLLAYIFLGFFRHNGLVYLAVVPFFWMLLGPFSWKRGAVYSLSALVLAFGLLWSMNHIRAIGGLDFLSTSLTQHTMFLKQTSLSKEGLRIGGDYFQVFDMDKEGTVSDKWHSYLDDRYSWNFLLESGLSDSYPYVAKKTSFPELREIIKTIYFASYEKPWKYLIWNPLHMLILIPLVLVGFRWFPSAAIFSGFLLCGIIPIVVINIFNWRYYYFFYFGLYFILPLIVFDMQKKERREVLNLQ
jgi:hypothetical protein